MKVFHSFLFNVGVELGSMFSVKIIEFFVDNVLPYLQHGFIT